MHDPALIDQVLERVGQIPEPVARAGLRIERSRSLSDVTGLSLALCDLGMGVVRYAVSVGLAGLKAGLGDQVAPPPLASALRQAARMSDGHWCSLARTVSRELGARDARLARLVSFVDSRAVTNLVRTRNAVAHERSIGVDTPERALAVLDAARDLLDIPLLMHDRSDQFEHRVGTPRAGHPWPAWTGSPPPEGLGRTLLALPGRWLGVDPWLPEIEPELWLLEHPRTPGEPWRGVDLGSGRAESSSQTTSALERLSDHLHAPVALSHRPDLVGRESVVACLLRAARDAAGGAVRVLLLTGRMGIGRTRLLTEMREAAPGLDLETVVHAPCSADRMGPLSPLLRAVSGVPKLEAVERAILALSSGDALATAESVQASLERIALVLLEASRNASIMLGIDDLQWADAHTLGVLKLLTEIGIEGAVGRVLLLGTVRDEPRYGPVLSHWIELVEREAGPVATRLVLAPLGDPEARRLVQGVAPSALRVRDAIVRDAGGLPFWLVQRFLNWRDSGVLRWQPDGWDAIDAQTLEQPSPTASALVSASLAAHFLAKSALERTAERVLSMVALGPRSVAPGVLLESATELGLALDEVEEAVDKLCDSGLLGFDPDRHEYCFEQEIIRREVVARYHSRLWFGRVHRSVLDVLSTRTVAAEKGALAGFLATGYLELGELGLGRSWLYQALEHSWLAGAFEETVVLASRMVEVAGSAEERERAELRVLQAMLAAGRPRDARRYLDAVRTGPPVGAETDLNRRMLAMLADYELGEFRPEEEVSLVEDADRLGSWPLRIECRLARARCLRGRQGLTLLETALPLLDPMAADMRALLDYRVYALHLELLYECSAEPESCRSSAMKMREALRRAGSLTRQLETEMNLAVLQVEAGDYGSGLDALSDVKTRADAAGVPSDLRAEVRVNLAASELRAGRPESAAAHAEEAAQLTRDAGRWRHLAQSLSVLAAARLGMGKASDAEQAIEEAVRLKKKGGEKRLAFTLMRRARVRELLGNRAGAEQDVREALAAAEREEDLPNMLYARLWLAVELVPQDAREAQAEIAAVLRKLEQAGRLHPDVHELVVRSRRVVGEAAGA